MSEQLVARVPGQSRRMTGWSLVSVLPLCAMAAAAFAQTVPPGLRACTRETDSLRRLVCYDKEMARLMAAPARPAAVVPAPAGPAPAASAAPAPNADEPANATPAAAPPREPAPAQAPAAPAAASTTSQPATSSPLKSAWKAFTGGSSSHLTAHIASMDRWPNAMVLHLDNGQVWEQIGQSSGDLTLQVGDSVTIDKHFGSYWLSSRHVSNMQVRLRTD